MYIPAKILRVSAAPVYLYFNPVLEFSSSKLISTWSGSGQAVKNWFMLWDSKAHHIKQLNSLQVIELLEQMLRVEYLILMSSRWGYRDNIQIDGERTAHEYTRKCFRNVFLSRFKENWTIDASIASKNHINSRISV